MQPGTHSPPTQMRPEPLLPGLHWPSLAQAAPPLLLLPLLLLPLLLLLLLPLLLLPSSVESSPVLVGGSSSPVLAPPAHGPTAALVFVTVTSY